MKKIFNLIAVLSLLTVILLLAIAARKKENMIEPDITGRWITQVTDSRLVQQYEFKNNHTFEYSLISTDPATKKITGIATKTVGKYHVNSMQLDLYDIVNYTNKKQRAGSVAELVTVDGTKTTNNTIALDSKTNTLSVFFKCPPNADCFPLRAVYYKQ
jgi:hypothetical protein